MADPSFDKLSEAEWKTRLSPAEFRVLRQKDTERPFTGKLADSGYGIYRCAGCSAMLYTSSTKFDSGCGWPAFWGEIPGSVKRTDDNSGGQKRIEITCSACDGHLGHVFEGEDFGNPTAVRHCVNAVSLKFDANVPAKICAAIDLKIKALVAK